MERSRCRYSSIWEALPSCLATLRHVDLDMNEVWISNCGSQATELAPKRGDVHWVEHGFQGFEWRIGGAAPQHISKPGPVTLARMTRVCGESVMLIASGRALEQPREKPAETYWEFSPHTFVRLNADARTFAQKVRCNHLHLVYGEYVPHLVECCRVLGVRPIVLE